MAKKSRKKPAPKDATMRNVRASHGRDNELHRRVQKLETLTLWLQAEVLKLMNVRSVEADRIEQFGWRIEKLEGLVDRQTEVINSLGERKV